MKRFYNEVATQAQGQGWQVTLDGRAIKTAGGNAQRVPSLALAEAMAREWSTQGEEIDPRAFQLRDLADYAIDVASGEARDSLIDEINGSGPPVIQIGGAVIKPGLGQVAPVVARRRGGDLQQTAIRPAAA